MFQGKTNIMILKFNEKFQFAENSWVALDELMSTKQNDNWGKGRKIQRNN